MEIEKEVLGEKHPDYAMSLDNLAVLYREMGDYDKAAPLYIKVMEIEKEVLGENHPSYVASLNDLASLHQEMGNFAEAEPLYVKVMEIEKEAHGEKPSQLCHQPAQSRCAVSRNGGLC